MTRAAAILVLSASLAPVPPQYVTVTPEQQKAIDAYARERKRVDSLRGDSLEPLLAAAHRVIEVMSDVTSKPGEPPPPFLDDLAEAELSRIQRLLPGLDLHNADVVAVLLDSDFFWSLARNHGRPVDVEFFALYRRTHPAGQWWSAWLEQTGPESVCIDFTSGELVDLYAAWRRFQRIHGKRYAAAVAKELSEIEEDLLSDRRRWCSEDVQLVRRELDRLIAMLPADPIASAVQKRLSELPR